MHEHFLQSENWKKFQLALGHTVIEHRTKSWSYLAVLDQDRFGTYAYIPYGPYAKDSNALTEAVAHARAAATDAGAYTLYIEPYLPISREQANELLPKLGAHKTVHRQPPATQIISLEGTEEDIVGNMNATRRNEHRNHSKKGLEIKQTRDASDIDIFIDLLQGSAEKKGFFVRDKTFFKTLASTLMANNNAALYIGWYEKTKPVIAAIAYDDVDTRYYAFMGRDYAYQHLQPNGPLVSRMIVDAKAIGKKSFDLYGIADDDAASNPWRGFTKFKKTLGGESILLSGTWEIPLKKSRYRAKKVLHTLKKLSRKN